MIMDAMEAMVGDIVERSVKQVVNGDVTSTPVPRLKLDYYMQAIPRLLGVDYLDYDFEYNGFQIDFWVTFKGGYILSGDLWYEDNFTFSKEVK